MLPINGSTTGGNMWNTLRIPHDVLISISHLEKVLNIILIEWLSVVWHLNKHPAYSNVWYVHQPSDYVGPTPNIMTIIIVTLINKYHIRATIWKHTVEKTELYYHSLSLWTNHHGNKYIEWIVLFSGTWRHSSLLVVLERFTGLASWILPWTRACDRNGPVTPFWIT